MEPKKSTKSVTNIFLGQIVHCKDQDSLDEFNVEVLINEKCDLQAIMQYAEQEANKDPLVQLTGNSFEFEYLEPSGRRVLVVKTIVKEITELSEASREGKALLEERSMG